MPLSCLRPLIVFLSSSCLDLTSILPSQLSLVSNSAHLIGGVALPDVPFTMYHHGPDTVAQYGTLTVHSSLRDSDLSSPTFRACPRILFRHTREAPSPSATHAPLRATSRLSKSGYSVRCLYLHVKDNYGSLIICAISNITARHVRQSQKYTYVVKRPLASEERRNQTLYTVGMMQRIIDSSSPLANNAIACLG